MAPDGLHACVPDNFPGRITTLVHAGSSPRAAVTNILHSSMPDTLSRASFAGASLVLSTCYFIPIVGVEKRCAYELVHGDLPRQHSFRTTLRFTGSVPAESRQ